MLTSKLSVAAILAAGSLTSVNAPFEAPPVKAPRYNRRSVQSSSYSRGATGKRYPEQSSRQEMRAHRRAQGGLGIQLKNGVYEPKATFDDYLPR